MAFRIETAIAIGVLAAALAGAQEFKVRHDHLRKSGAGVLRVEASGIAFVEEAKAGHSRTWAYDDIQQLTLGSGSIRVLGYEDAGWKAGRDREWVFEGLSEGDAVKLLPLLQGRLEQRLVAAIADSGVAPQWELPVKLKNGLGGSDGRLIAGEDAVVYRSSERGESRTWRIEDIANVASGGPYSLTITVLERSGLLRGGPRDFEFQLKRPLTETRYQELWRRVNGAKGLFILKGETQK